jgi:hypothetical protein
MVEDHPYDGGPLVKDKLLSAFHNWQERRRARRVAQAEAAKSLKDEPSKTGHGSNIHGGGGDASAGGFGGDAGFGGGL